MVATTEEERHLTIEDVRNVADEGLVEIDGEQHYRINGVDRMPPFLMSVVSDGDRWMFVSSSGALTAGRRDATQALFPYVTDDRLHGAGGTSGPVTALRIGGHGEIWQPFAAGPQTGTSRSISKTVLSDSVRFEERHADLGLTFSYRWSSAERFGFVRTATLHNDGPARVTVDVVDGLVDLLPHGLEPIVYHRLSNLTNAYKRSEVVDAPTGLALYTLESPVSDQAEPEEVLRATAVWSTGFDGDLDLSAESLSAFRDGIDLAPRHLLTGRPGAYLRRGAIDLEPGAAAIWYIVADVARDQVDVTELRRSLRQHTDLAHELEAATRRTGEHLANIMAPADAVQHTGDAVACAHHFSNVIYNVMRGGVPLDGYRLDTRDFADFVQQRNSAVAAHHAPWLDALPATIERRDLVARIAEIDDVHLTRLGDEYLPFRFSRRHGDPSRPWNQFSIRVTGADGEPVMYYEGNWRDVFQNWEALCASFPEFLPGVVSTFVNASTADGYNPYRITRNGIDWEVPDPDDPWANIGYWGDHQVVYLLRLLEATEAYLPGEIARRLTVRSCTYADVPYRIAPYADLVRDPKSTIEFDEAADERSSRRVAEIGADGKMLLDRDGDVVLVPMAEKFLVTALAKLSNFVPGGGIWMNTQRPEWNDANNALVGSGLSMVTLFHLRRFLDHLRTLMSSVVDDVELSAEVATWFDGVLAALDRAPIGASGDQDVDRRTILDRLGTAASDYRTTIYESGLSGATRPVSPATIAGLCDAAIAHLDETIGGSRRPDGLVHAYNLLRLPDDETASVAHLPEMLEGQVAALTAGLFSPREQADLLDALFTSALYRPDQQSFVLTPARTLPGFLGKNVIDPADVERNPLLTGLLGDGDRSIVRLDADGNHRFAPDLTTAPELAAHLDRLESTDRWADLVGRFRQATLATYETVFEHQSHLGRSGSMHAYEGIGSVYWHMVTKLLLAVQEALSDAVDRGAGADDLARLAAAYWRVRDGLGFNKTAEEFGAVPIDPYSHTPAHAGAQQPGMTGAVKEEILARRRELGVRVEAGRVVFDALLLRSAELVDRDATWTVRTERGAEVDIELDVGSLGLTVCQVPVVVSVAPREPFVEIAFADGRIEHHDGDRLDRNTSAAIFGRTGEVVRLHAAVRLL